jgi:hypothetical protein
VGNPASAPRRTAERASAGRRSRPFGQLTTSTHTRACATRCVARWRYLDGMMAYGTVPDQAEVSPDSKPSAKSS